MDEQRERAQQRIIEEQEIVRAQEDLADLRELRDSTFGKRYWPRRLKMLRDTLVAEMIAGLTALDYERYVARIAQIDEIAALPANDRKTAHQLLHPGKPLEED